MNSEDYIESTKEALLTTFKYCEENNLRFWVEENHSNIFSFRIGEDEDYFAAMDKKRVNPYSYVNISEVYEGMIHHTDFDMFNQSGNTNCRIQTASNFARKQPKKYNEFYIDFFWKHGKELTKILYEDYIRNQLDLNYIIDYKTEQYPNGFADNKVIPYSSEVNWIHFLDTIENKKLANFWENENHFKNFYEKLKQLKQSNKIMVHSTLRTLTERLIAHGLSDDAMFKTSYMLMDILPENLHQGYSAKFPLMKTLMDKLYKQSLFPDTQEEIIERVIFPKIHLYEYFNSEKLISSQYPELAEETLKKLKNNFKLEEKGLISSEIAGNDDITFYMVLKDNNFVNKSSIKQLCIKIMESFINHDDMIIEAKASLLRDKCDLNLLEQISNTIVDHWILDKELEINQPKDTGKRKIKKV
jgi:hypothetical protein